HWTDFLTRFDALDNAIKQIVRAAPGDSVRAGTALKQRKTGVSAGFFISILKRFSEEALLLPPAGALGLLLFAFA
ncbi:hypothetical protein, partial [Brucella intermedia]|uniref:hypothetical protein n=1 Tax=Brucella intermedia TaxID=94625 RepID=UPI001AEC7722